MVCPPYYNRNALLKLSKDICADCIGTVPIGTATDDFCNLLFTDERSPCCDELFVFEGNNIWWSDDNCLSWHFYGSNTSPEVIELSELFYTATTVVATKFNIVGIPQTYDEIYVEIIGRGNSTLPANTYVKVELNGDAVHTNYKGGFEYTRTDVVLDTSIGSFPMIVSYVPSNSEPATAISEIKISMQDYANTTKSKQIHALSNWRNVAGTIQSANARGHQTWAGIAGITSFKVELTTLTNPTTSNFFKAGTIINVWLKKRYNVLISD